MGKFSFAGIAEAKVGLGGVYLEEGVYTLQVKAIKMVTSRKKDDLYTVECKILESSNPKRPVGTTATWQVNMSQDAALGNVKGFLKALAGFEVDSDDCEISEEDAANSIDDETNSELVGRRIGCEVVKVLTKAKTEFSKHNWSPASNA